MSIIIYHNPACGTSRTTLALLREKGAKPTIIEYLKKPFRRTELLSLIDQMGLSPRELLRQKEKLYSDLKLDDPTWSEDELVDFMVEHPILINRPIVVTPLGARLCRPAEKVLELLA